jgi:hypothetical protein
MGRIAEGRFVRGAVAVGAEFHGTLLAQLTQQNTAFGNYGQQR